MADIKMGLLGVGSMGKNHARVIRQTEGMDLVAIADPAGDKFGVAGDLEVLPDVGALIDAGIDAAMVAVPTAYHEDAALELAAAGIPTMIEKPLSHDVASGRRIADAFESKGLVGAVGYVERCNPALLALRERIAAGQLGDVFQVSTRRQSPFPARIADVGVVKDLATHDVDLAAWIAGSEYETVFAQTTTRSGRDHEDMVSVAGRMKNGVLVNHLVNWLNPYKDRCTVVLGEKGALVADTLMSDLTFYANGQAPLQWEAMTAFRGVSEGEITTYALTKREPLAVEQENFRDAINGDPSKIVTMIEAMRTLEVVQAILDSAETGQSVRLG